MGHTGAVLDFDFNPFADDMVATASEDATLKLWTIPSDGVTENITEPITELAGHTHKVVACQFNPVASEVLASVSTRTMLIWDCSTAQTKHAIEGQHGEVIQSIDWNHTGTLIASTCKDRQVRIFDPRTCTPTAQFYGHRGIKACSPFFIDTFRIGTVGFDERHQREIRIFDVRHFRAVALHQVLDDGGGALVPLFDPDTNLLFLPGKGDTSTRIFEITDELTQVNAHRGLQSMRGCCALPKRHCDVNKKEIARLIYLTSKKTVEPTSFIVPRRSEEFQEDLFPDTCVSPELLR